MTVTNSTVQSLTTLAEQALEVARACLAQTSAGTPALSYISPSLPAYDCGEALIVAVSALREEVTSPLGAIDTGRRTTYGQVSLVAITITALRCAPEMNPDGSVPVAGIEAAARAVQEDGWALWCGFYNAIIRGEFSDLCEVVHFDGGNAITEQGGVVGWSMTMRASLGGISLDGI